ncbi:MAG: hypothetical protein Q7S23_02300 [bacterium]|nr:hypothetical protein [bacterium]
MLSREKRTIAIRAALLLVVLVVLVVPSLVLGQQPPASALNYNAQIPIPGSSEQARAIQGNKVINANLLGNYVVAIYRFGIWLSIFLTIFMMMVGGFLWVIAGGNPSRVENAKSYITSALTGLVVALTSFVILQTVNPAIVIFNPIEPKKPTGLTDTGCCCTATAGDIVAACAPSSCPTGEDVRVGEVCQKMSGSGFTGGRFDANHSCLGAFMLSDLAHPSGNRKAPTELNYYGSCDGGNQQPQTISLRAFRMGCCQVIKSETWWTDIIAGTVGRVACFEVPSEECCDEQASALLPDDVVFSKQTCASLVLTSGTGACDAGVRRADTSSDNCK